LEIYPKPGRKRPGSAWEGPSLCGLSVQARGDSKEELNPDEPMRERDAFVKELVVSAETFGISECWGDGCDEALVCELGMLQASLAGGALKPLPSSELVKLSPFVSWPSCDDSGEIFSDSVCDSRLDCCEDRSS
jgi:hypothetical protein